ncbi:MAG: GNAT family N-acetyltransferase [Spirochaetales bacterium]|nr:GNAT family N-acetyltransferase [Spirochaetales bacterium]
MNAPIDISDVVLKTERLTLRPWRQSDLDDFFEYASVDGVGQMAGWPPHRSKEDSQSILDRFIAHKRTFAIEHNGKVIGSVGIEKYDDWKFPDYTDKRCREIGYVLSKDYWGHGIMPEAVKRVIRYLFEDVGLDAIFCGHFLRNGRSARVQEKCGFEHLLYDKYQTSMETLEDNEVNILTRERWLSLKDN